MIGILGFKDHRQRISQICYKTVFRKINTEETFFAISNHYITNRLFSKKNTIINSISENLVSWFIYGRDVIGANCVEKIPENGKMKCFYYYNYYYYNRTQHSKPLR